MAKHIDVRGLSCPQPVMLVKRAIDAGENELVVIVDDAVAIGNIERFAANYNFSLSRNNRGSEILLLLKRK